MISALSLCVILGLAGVRDTAQFKADQDAAARDVEDLITMEGELYILSLDSRDRTTYATNNEKYFHGFGIMGRAEVADPNVRKLLLSRLAESIRHSSGVVAACFNPRHGVYLRAPDRTVDIVICFECASARAYGTGNRGFLLTRSAEPAFNEFLDKKGIPREKEDTE